MAGAIRFGASVSVSGRNALQGRQVLAGLRAWVEAVNAPGGLKVHGAGARAPVRLVYHDDASSPARAAANAERLLDADAVEVLIGPYASDLTRAVLPVAGRRGKVLWNHGGASDDIHMEGGRAIGILTPVSRYYGGLLELVRSLDSDAGRVALLHRRGSSFGRLAGLGVRAAASGAMFVADVVTYSSLTSDLPSVLASLQRHRPDLVISAGSFDDEVVLARALLESGLRPKAIGLAAAALQEFPQALGTSAEGFLGPSQWEPRLAYAPDFGPGPDEATEGIRAQGAPPDYPAAQAYAACLIAQRCLEEAGADDESLWRAACALDCGTFFGRFRIDPATGLQVGHEMVLVQWRRGRKVVVWPPPVSKARPLSRRRSAAPPR
ncbi:MAG: amino acid ABC transporter substrate-binding protein [Actinomycetota bacterium]